MELFYGNVHANVYRQEVDIDTAYLPGYMCRTTLMLLFAH
jgi:hypothetical protein